MNLQEIAKELVDKFFNKYQKFALILGIIILIVALTALFE